MRRAPADKTDRARAIDKGGDAFRVPVQSPGSESRFRVPTEATWSRRTDRPVAYPMTSRWPTDLEAHGTAPANIALVTSGDEHLMRQALYQLQAATQLQDRGFKVEGFQLAVVGKMIRITVPIVSPLRPVSDAVGKPLGSNNGASQPVALSPRPITADR